MVCVVDEVHLFQAVLYFDVCVYTLVFIDVYSATSSIYSAVNLGVLGMADPSVYPMIAVLLITLVFAAFFLTSFGTIVTASILVGLLGTTFTVGQQYVIEWLGYTWGANVDSEAKLYAIGMLVLLIIVACALLYAWTRVTRYFIRSLLCAILTTVAFRSLWFNGWLPDSLCCSADQLHDCALYLGVNDALMIAGLFWLRLVAFASFRWYAKPAEEWRIAKQLMKKKQVPVRCDNNNHLTIVPEGEEDDDDADDASAALLLHQS
jgi:hypothetical protein